MRILLHRCIYRWALLALLVIVATPARVAPAQSGPTRGFDFVGRGIPLSAALERLVHETRIDLYYDPPLVANKRSNCVMQDASAEDILRCILDGTGLDFIRLSSGLYVLTTATETTPLYGKLSGIVVDADTGQPLANAHVMLNEAQAGTTSNEAGMFAFARLKPGRYQVVAKFIGYRTGAAHVEVPPGGATRTELALKSEPMLVEPIVIDGLQWRLPSRSLGRAEIGPDGVEQTPSPGGSGVFLGLGTLLGVRVNDATADIHIQGGETGEHQVRLDGAPVFLPLSFASFVGPFSPFAVGSIAVHKAGFGATEGSQISGIIDIEHELSIPEPRRFDVQVDPLSVNARASVRRGSTETVQASLMAAGRLSLWRFYQPPALRDLLASWNTPDSFLAANFENGSVYIDSTAGLPRIGFADLHVASRLRFDPLRSLHTSFYWGTSHLGTSLGEEDPLSDQRNALDAAPDAEGPTDLFTWHTGVAQTRYESVLDARTFVQARLRGSYYRVRHGFERTDSQLDDERTADDGNQIYELGALVSVDRAVGDRHTVRTGAELTHTSSRFVVLGAQQFTIEHRSASWRIAAFLEDEITLMPGLTADLGGRLTYLPQKKAVYAEPRASLRLDHDRSRIGPWSARLSAGVYRQFSNQFDVSSRSPRALISSTRFWLVADSTIQPPIAAHFSAEWLYRPAPKWSLRLEAYHKHQPRILTINYGARLDEPVEGNLPQKAFLTYSHGSVTGTGVQVRRDLGLGRAEVRYELSVAKRAYEEFYGSRTLPAPWNEPHRIELLVDVMPLPDVTFLARWRGVYGRTWGFRQGYYDFAGAFGGDGSPERIRRQIERYRLYAPDDDLNRLPPIQQLDISLAYTRRVGSVTLQARTDVSNVLNRDNVAERHLVLDEAYFDPNNPNSGILKVAERPLLPRVFTVAFRLSW